MAGAGRQQWSGVFLTVNTCSAGPTSSSLPLSITATRFAVLRDHRQAV